MTDDLRRLTVKLNDLENAHNASKKKIAAFEADARRFTARDEELARKTQDLEKRCDKLEMELKASEWNSVARLSNSRVTDPHQVLSQLHERNTNKPIKGFPKHEQDIRIMSQAEVFTVLKCMGAETTGTPADRKARLRSEIGSPAEKSPPTEKSTGAEKNGVVEKKPPAPATPVDKKPTTPVKKTPVHTPVHTPVNGEKKIT